VKHKKNPLAVHENISTISTTGPISYLSTTPMHSVQLLQLLQLSFPSTTVTNEAHWVHDLKYHSAPDSISHTVASTDSRHSCK